MKIAKKLTVGLVDDHAITRKGLKALLEMTNQYNVILEASTGKELVHLLQITSQHPDMIILDVSMPELDGYQTLTTVNSTYPLIKILIFSFYHTDDVILNVLSKGACGYVSKNTDPEILLEAVQSVSQYGFYLNDQQKRKLGQQKPQKSRTGFHGKQVLTEKEIQFIRFATSNLTYKEIAIAMNVPPKTLENYRDSVFQKLGINNRAALTLYAIQNGIVQLF
jgi:DNA-binding NarL/FixJ family response regulator